MTTDEFLDRIGEDRHRLLIKPTADQVIEIIRKALVEIRKCGRVCDNFELCKHASCDDSAHSYMLAGDALREAGFLE